MSAMALSTAGAGAHAVYLLSLVIADDTEAYGLLTGGLPSKSLNHKHLCWKGSFKSVRFFSFIPEKVVFA